MSNISLQIKRVYEPYDPADGMRVLVDRLWPRGVRKEAAHIDLWLKDVAPSPELRQWFCHDPEKFTDFTSAYQLELEQESVQRQAVQQLVEHIADGPVTLVYAAKDPVHNHVVVLRDFLFSCLKGSPDKSG